MPRLCADCSSLVPGASCPHCGSRNSGATSYKPGPTRLVATLMVLGLTLGMDGPGDTVVALYGVIATEPARPIPVRPAKDLLEDAAQRVREGDLDGAEILLSEAERQSGDFALEVAYQRANILALRRKYPEARAAYLAIVDRFPGSARERDAQYRVAELTGVIGDPRAAAESMDALKELDDLSEADLAKIRLNEAYFRAQFVKPKKARKTLIKALSKVEPGLVSYYEAKAWTALSDERLDRADEIELDGRERKLKRAMKKRVALMRQGDEILRQAVALKEPDSVFAGLLRLAESFEALGDDMLTAEDPKSLTPAQLEIYRDGVAEQAEASWARAVQYLDGGVTVAETVAWKGSHVDALREQRARLMRKVEAGAPRK